MTRLRCPENKVTASNRNCIGISKFRPPEPIDDTVELNVKNKFEKRSKQVEEKLKTPVTQSRDVLCVRSWVTWIV